MLVERMRETEKKEAFADMWRIMEKKHENYPGNFCFMLPIMHGIDSYSA